MGATVISNLEKLSNSETVVGLTVGEVRRRFHDARNIPDNARATINGAAVDEDEVVDNGDELIFSRPLGSKG